MIRFRALRYLPALLLVGSLFFSSCSGLKTTVCTVNCGGGGGTGTVNVTVTSTPSNTFFFPFLAWEITSVQLINGSGSGATIVQGALPPVDFARLQPDSQFLGTGNTVPAGP